MKSQHLSECVTHPANVFIFFNLLTEINIQMRLDPRILSKNSSTNLLRWIKKNIAFGWNEVYFPPTRHTRWIIYFVCWREVNSRWPKILHQNEASCCTFCYLWIHVQIFNLWQIFRNHVEMNCMNSTRKDQRWNKLKAKRVGIMLECGSVKEIESSRSSVEAFAEKYNMTGLNSLSAIFQTKFF